MHYSQLYLNTGDAKASGNLGNLSEATPDNSRVELQFKVFIDIRRKAVGTFVKLQLKSHYLAFG